MMSQSEREAMRLEEPTHCDDCGEAFKDWDAKAVIIRRPGGDLLVVHAECMRRGDEIA